MPREKILGGYGEKAVCRKAEYNQVGRGNQCVGNPDYEKATQRMTIFTGIPIFINILSLAA